MGIYYTIEELKDKNIIHKLCKYRKQAADYYNAYDDNHVVELSFEEERLFDPYPNKIKQNKIN